MIDTRYDEDLLENSFFQDLKKENPDLIGRVTRDQWIICIPRADSFQRSSLTQDDFLTHILVPNDELPETHYRTLSGKQVTVSNRVITVENDDIASSICTHIIFEETFYTEEMKKYKIWCTESPLNHTTFQFDTKNGCYNTVLTLRDCIDLLWGECLGKGILEPLDLILEVFLSKHKTLENNSLQTQNDLICTLYAKCLQTTLREARLRDRTTKNKQLLDNVKISVESYMQHSIYKKLFTSISVCTAFDDSSFNKIVRNLSDYQLRDLNIKTDFYETIPCAKRELAKINGYSTVLGKVGCLRNTLSEISKLSDIEGKSNYLAADDLLPIFVFLVLKTSIPNWIANLVFLKQFQFSSVSTADESKFLITTLEAAIEHIRSGMLIGPVEPESQIYESDKKAANIKVCDDGNNNVVHLFEKVRLGHYEEVNTILHKSKNENVQTSVKELCHPLCSCDKCERLLKQNICCTTPTVHSCDDRGFTALHVACMYGKPKIVELLLENRANIQSCDYSGATPLHYAAMRGHQNALLLLLHSGADINAIDSEKSTPLHFCCNNGHETCVKAMLYFSEHTASGIDVNCMNALGNTALHYASRWGYESIVQILLEYGANPGIENKHKKTALDCAHNLKIYQLIKNTKRFSKQVKPTTFKNDLVNKELDFVEEKSNTSLIQQETGKKPESTQEMKKAELLLRAVAYGDVPLICYYLGFDIPEIHKIQNRNPASLCHPLCNCEKCEFIEDQINLTHETQDVNVCNSEGYTSLHMASLHGRTEIVRLLLNNGAVPNIVTRKGLTALHLACQTQRHEIVNLLIRSTRCSVNIQDGRGNTALHYACYSKDQRLAEKLVANGADINIKNINDITPLHEAEEKMLFGLMKILNRIPNQ